MSRGLSDYICLSWESGFCYGSMIGDQIMIRVAIACAIAPLERSGVILWTWEDGRSRSFAWEQYKRHSKYGFNHTSPNNLSFDDQSSYNRKEKQLRLDCSEPQELGQPCPYGGRPQGLRTILELRSKHQLHKQVFALTSRLGITSSWHLSSFAMMKRLDILTWSFQEHWPSTLWIVGTKVLYDGKTFIKIQKFVVYRHQNVINTYSLNFQSPTVEIFAHLIAINQDQSSAFSRANSKEANCVGVWRWAARGERGQARHLNLMPGPMIERKFQARYISHQAIISPNTDIWSSCNGR